LTNVLHLKQPNFPHLRFEWHPQTKRCYVIRLDTPPNEPVIAEPFAWQVVNSGQAHNAVLVYLRGYKHAMAEMALRPAEQHERSPYVAIA
jgi:hypothetical protein